MIARTIKTKIDGMDLWYREDDKFIGQRIALGKYERYETGLIMSQINRESVVVDIGANIGVYTIQMAKRAKKVYAIEPDREIFKILTKNVEENGFDNVELINAAAGAKKEKLNFFKNTNNFGDGRVGKIEGRYKTVEINRLVDCLRLDDILINEQYISLIKIDTQGWEPEVIEGAKKVIEKDSPVLFLEYTPSDYRDEKMINFLQSYYKNIWSINDYAQVPWPIDKGIVINSDSGYTDLWLKKRMRLKDYLTILKGVNYKKLLKGIIKPIWQK